MQLEDQTTATAKAAKSEESRSSGESTMLNDHADKSGNGPPPLRFSFRWTTLCLYLAFLLFCNVLVPCLLYYLLQIFTPLSLQSLVGISSAALGISSCVDAPVRLYKLVRYRQKYGPLNDDEWWHLDSFMWIYTFCLFVFAFPLSIAPAVPLYNFFLMSTAMLVGPLGIIYLISLLAFRLPGVWCSSDRPGTPMKPAAFYTVEDIVAVDFMHGRDYRTAIHERWHASPPFRKMMSYLTLYWGLSMLLYVGVTAAVTWAAPFDFAFGWVLGQFFIWAAVSALGSWMLTKWCLAAERHWWSQQKHAEKGDSLG